MTPLVSVCVPNLNTYPYLRDRFQTIFEQSLTDWELLVYDSHSEDGAWELIQQVAKSEPRMRVWQGPREGTPGSWNPCIKQAQGKYVYIATSDDTMAPNCLERLAEALERHPECDLAHCRVRMIDEKGLDAPDWWSKWSLFVLSRGELLNREHVCRAPFDGMLHLTGNTVYTSITQLLIRRSLFDKIGLFESRWGGMGDFNWDMRAALVANTVHVPDTWGGWRIHSAQATAANNPGSPGYWLKLNEMIDDAIRRSRDCLPDRFSNELLSSWLEKARDAREVCHELQNCAERPGRQWLLLKRVAEGSWAARKRLVARLTGRDFSWPLTGPATIAEWMRQAGSRDYLVPS